MAQESTPDSRRRSCSRCGVGFSSSAYEVRAAVGTAFRCLRCTLLHRPLVRRSLLICLVVGTLLTAINHGDLIVQGDLPTGVAWKVPLTYLVPYWVSTLGAVLNARRTLSF